MGRHPILSGKTPLVFPLSCEKDYKHKPTGTAVGSSTGLKPMLRPRKQDFVRSSLVESFNVKFWKRMRSKEQELASNMKRCISAQWIQPSAEPRDISITL